MELITPLLLTLNCDFAEHQQAWSGRQKGCFLIIEGISWWSPLSSFTSYAYFGIFDQSAISTASIEFIKKGSSGHVINSPLFTWNRNDPLLGHTSKIREFF